MDQDQFRVSGAAPNARRACRLRIRLSEAYQSPKLQVRRAKVSDDCPLMSCRLQGCGD
ncbi:MAG: hypothetical protein J0H01_05615 [Rhizobiales bacterium]|nr:hypothetical protein [Hyphomicrobiales bacterium]